MLEYFDKGGPLMFVLLVCSIVAVAIFIERFIYLMKTKKKIDALSKKIESCDYSDLDSIAKKLDEHKDNILSKLMRKTIDNVRLPMGLIKEDVEREANKEVSKLDKNLSALGVIYNIAPMLGLLGTILGLTITLQDLVSDPEKLLTGIYMSLLTTIAGLIVAIPKHIGHSYLTSKVNRIVLNLEIASSTFMEEIKKNNNNNNNG